MCNMPMPGPIIFEAGSKMAQQTFTKILVNAPPGRLGIHLYEYTNIDGEVGAYISKVNEDSPLAGEVHPGDKVVAIDEVDVSQAGLEGQCMHFNCS